MLRDPPLREGAAHDEQARLAGLEPQQAADTPLGQQRAHGVLGALQRRHAHQELVRGGAGEVVAQVAGRGQRVDVALLDLQRRAVLEVGEERVVERRAGPRREALGELATRGHALQRHHLQAVLVAAGADLVGDVAHLERVGMHALLGDEGADACDPHQHPVLGQLAQGAVGGHARDRQGAGELVLGRHALPGAQRPGRDAVEHEVLDLLVAGGGRLQRHGAPLLGAGRGPRLWWQPPPGCLYRLRAGDAGPAGAPGPGTGAPTAVPPGDELPVECAAPVVRRGAGTGGWYRCRDRDVRRAVPPRVSRSGKPPAGLFVFGVGL